MRHVVRATKAVVGLSLLGCVSFYPCTVMAEDASPPKSTATRPAKEPTGQTSIPSAAPPATSTQTTGSTNQDATNKKMNEEGKKKVDIEGK
jgi:hypothetical protein